ncbi:unnamed protein product [Amaranthus hypochondriacus]
MVEPAKARGPGRPRKSEALKSAAVATQTDGQTDKMKQQGAAAGTEELARSEIEMSKATPPNSMAATGMNSRKKISSEETQNDCGGLNRIVPQAATMPS